MPASLTPSTGGRSRSTANTTTRLVSTTEAGRARVLTVLVPPLVGAAIFGVGMYVVSDTSLVEAAAYGVAFATIIGLARWLWSRVRFR
jgi:hypothetical protein